MEITNKNTKADNLIYQRFSPREFLDTEIDQDKILTLFEAARWAASSYNEQPWFFIYGHKGRQDETYERLLSCMIEFNQDWAEEAPFLMLTVVKTYFEKDRSTNRHAFHDLGLAMGNFTFQATKLNLKLHHMAGFDTNEARRIFNIPDGYEPVTMVALGFSNENKIGRTRKPIEEFVFNNKFEVEALETS